MDTSCSVISRANNITILLEVTPLKFLVGKTGFEPATPWSQTTCATKLRHFPKWCGLKDSNLRPPACKAGALTYWAKPAYIILNRYTSHLGSYLSAPHRTCSLRRSFLHPRRIKYLSLSHPQPLLISFPISYIPFKNCT